MCFQILAGRDCLQIDVLAGVSLKTVPQEVLVGALSNREVFLVLVDILSLEVVNRDIFLLRRARELPVLVAVHGLPLLGTALHLDAGHLVEGLLLVERLHVLEVLHLVDEASLLRWLMLASSGAAFTIVSQLLPHVVLGQVVGLAAHNKVRQLILREPVLLGNFELNKRWAGRLLGDHLLRRSLMLGGRLSAASEVVPRVATPALELTGHGGSKVATILVIGIVGGCLDLLAHLPEEVVRHDGLPEANLLVVVLGVDVLLADGALDCVFELLLVELI